MEGNSTFTPANMGGPIGQGRNGTVYVKKVDGDDVAIKFFKNVEFFTNELKFLKLCDFDEVIKIKFHEHLIIATHLMPGGSLQERLIDKSLDTKDRNLIAIILATGFEKMHNIGVAHRDIKPLNVVLDQYNRPKIIDMEFACFFEHGITGEVGTRFFMAPEVKYTNKYNEKCDVYSFGVLLFMLLCNKIDPKGFMDISSYPDCPSYTKELIKMCIDIDPNKRPSFSQIVEGMGQQGNLFENTPKPSLTNVLLRRTAPIIKPNSHKRNNKIISQKTNIMTANQKSPCITKKQRATSKNIMENP